MLPGGGLGTSGRGWIRGSKLGSGSYGCVYKALDRETGRIFAVKKAPFDASGDKESAKFAAVLREELNICRDLRHPNIVSYLGHEQGEHELYIFLDYMPGGSMSALLNEFGALQGATLMTAARGLVEGLCYLHTRSPPVVHRDIKGANVLVDLNFCVKLADFGCSKCDVQTKSFTTIGSIPWMAPEVLVQNGYGRKADIWSLGCTVLEMATAEKPWAGAKFDNIMCAIRHIGMSQSTPAIPDEVRGPVRELIECCVRRNVDERPSTTELLAEGGGLLRDVASR